jgi:hypothetical protein
MFITLIFFFFYLLFLGDFIVLFMIFKSPSSGQIFTVSSWNVGLNAYWNLKILIVQSKGYHYDISIMHIMCFDNIQPLYSIVLCVPATNPVQRHTHTHTHTHTQNHYLIHSSSTPLPFSLLFLDMKFQIIPACLHKLITSSHISKR